MTGARIPCFVPGCKRTRKAHAIWDEWLCPKHWGMVPKQMRRAYSHAKRHQKPRPAVLRIWRRCKTAAIHGNFTEGWE